MEAVVERLDALVAQTIGLGSQQSRANTEWELFHRALQRGIPCAINDPLTAHAACVALPALFVLENADGQRIS
jgi:hypothetical protein